MTAATDPDYHALTEALGCGRYESLSQAAFRVLRYNYHPPHIQRIARMVLAGSGKSGACQHDVLRKCAAVLAEHADPNTGPNTGPNREDT